MLLAETDSPKNYGKNAVSPGLNVTSQKCSALFDVPCPIILNISWKYVPAFS